MNTPTIQPVIFNKEADLSSLIVLEDKQRLLVL